MGSDGSLRKVTGPPICLARLSSTPVALEDRDDRRIGDELRRSRPLDGAIPEKRARFEGRSIGSKLEQDARARGRTICMNPKPFIAVRSNG
jgi:hypothetical protein